MRWPCTALVSGCAPASSRGCAAHVPHGSWHRSQGIPAGCCKRPDGVGAEGRMGCPMHATDPIPPFSAHRAHTPAHGASESRAHPGDKPRRGACRVITAMPPIPRAHEAQAGPTPTTRPPSLQQQGPLHPGIHGRPLLSLWLGTGCPSQNPKVSHSQQGPGGTPGKGPQGQEAQAPRAAEPGRPRRPAEAGGKDL